MWLSATVTAPTAHGPELRVVGSWPGTTGSSGVVRIQDARLIPKASYKLTINFQGVSYRSAEFFAGGRQPAELLVYQVTPKARDLSFVGRFSLDVGESSLRVTSILQLRNESGMTIDFTHAPEGLRLPTFAYTMGDKVFTWGLWPPGKVHGAPKPSTGQGLVEAEHGAPVFRGPVPPGERLFFQFSYNIPYKAAFGRLGLLSEYPIHDGSVEVNWTRRVHPRVRVEFPHRAVISQRDQFQHSVFVLGRTIEAGEPLIVRFEHLPIQTQVPQWLGLYGGLAALGVFACVLLGWVWRRQR